MARLEYRELQQGYPVLYYYEHILPEEIALRFACDYFIKEGTVYEKTSCAVEDADYVIYVKPSLSELPQPLEFAPRAGSAGICVEIRNALPNRKHHPLLEIRECAMMLQALLLLQSNFLYIRGKEWERTSTEIDEDRKVYVCYVQEAGTDDSAI
jgi:hypothetical protein